MFCRCRQVKNRLNTLFHRLHHIEFEKKNKEFHLLHFSFFILSFSWNRFYAIFLSNFIWNKNFFAKAKLIMLLSTLKEKRWSKKKKIYNKCTHPFNIISQSCRCQVKSTRKIQIVDSLNWCQPCSCWLHSNSKWRSNGWHIHPHLKLRFVFFSLVDHTYFTPDDYVL